MYSDPKGDAHCIKSCRSSRSFAVTSAWAHARRRKKKKRIAHRFVRLKSRAKEQVAFPHVRKWPHRNGSLLHLRGHSQPQCQSRQERSQHKWSKSNSRTSKGRRLTNLPARPRARSGAFWSTGATRAHSHERRERGLCLVTCALAALLA